MKSCVMSEEYKYVGVFFWPELKGLHKRDSFIDLWIGLDDPVW